MYGRFRSFAIATAVVVLLVIALPALSVVRAQSDQTAANKATVAALFQAFSASGDFSSLEPLVAADFVVHAEIGDLDWDGFKGGAQTMVAAMPDVAYTPLIMVAQGSAVAVRYETDGTFTNPMTNFDGSVLQPTGKPVHIDANAILTFTDDGKLASYTEIFDNLSFLAQLGAFPADESMMTAPAEADPSVWTIRETTSDFTQRLVASVSASNTAAYQDGDVDALDAAYTADYVSYPSGGDLAASKAQILALGSAISDLTAGYDSVIAEGNWVVYRWTMSGTFANGMSFNGVTLAPTHQPVRYQGIVFAYANEDGKIAADWNEVDNLSIGMQLGMIPAQ